MTQASRRLARATGPAGLPLLGVLALAAFLRFLMLPEIGIRGDDAIHYLTLARGWAEPPQDDFRQVILALYALVARLGGDADWSIKALNAGLDVANVALVFFAARRISRRGRVALMAALSYALLPRAIAFARTELLHTAATTCLLGSFALLVAWATTRRAGSARRAWLVGSAALAGLGYGVHPDLLPFVPGLAAAVLLTGVDAANGATLARRAGTALAHAALFGALALLVMVALGFDAGAIASRLVSGEEVARRASAAEASGVGGVTISHTEVLWNLVVFNSSPLLALLFYALLVVALAGLVLACWRGRRPALGPAALAPALPALSGLLLQPYAIWYVGPRHFLPGMPLVLVAVFVWMDRLLGRWLPDDARGAALRWAAGLALVLVNFASHPWTADMEARIAPAHRPLYKLYAPVTVPLSPWDFFDASKYPISNYRLVHDVLEDHVDAQHRLLVAPYAISSAGGTRRGFRHYFGEDAVYVEDCVIGLSEYVAAQRVRYVVFARFDLKRLERQPVCYGLRQAAYSPEREEALLFALLRQAGYEVRTLVESEELSILEIRRP